MVKFPFTWALRSSLRGLIGFRSQISDLSEQLANLPPATGSDGESWRLTDTRLLNRTDGI